MSNGSALPSSPGDRGTPAFVWRPAGKTACIFLSLDVVKRLEPLTRRGSEIGGILLGRRQNDGSIAVLDYHLVPCEYSHGPSYVLSHEDRSRLEAALEEYTGSVIGFFRSNTRKDLRLSAEDLLLAKHYFSGPEQVFMLVKPSAVKDNIGAFFFWEDGAIQAETYGQFPFSPVTLEQGEYSKTVIGDAREQKKERAPVLPINKRTEHLRPVLPSADETPNDSPKPPVLVQPPTPVEHPAATPVQKTPETPGKSRKWIAIGAVLAAGVAGATYFAWQRKPVSPPVTQPPVSTPAAAVGLAPENRGLGLKVERYAGQLTLTWGREADPIQNATSAVLSIVDGDRKEDVNLDLAQLKTGSIVYSPLTRDVSFHLTVTSSKDKSPVSENVRILGLRPSALGNEETSKQADTAAPEAPRPARRTFSTESLASRISAPAAVELPEPPPVDGQALSAVPASLATPSLPGAPPPVKETPTPSVAAPVPAPVRSAGAAREAKLVQRVPPRYPPIAMQARVEGTVAIDATIGRDGRVIQAKSVGGPALLRQAAVDAVRQWVYTPAQLNGQPVETVTRVDVRFTLK